jgi:hypothetical protein
MALRGSDEFENRRLDEVITDPESDEAVQIPDSPLVDASKLGENSVHDEPSPNEVAEKASKSSSKPSKPDSDSK